MYAIVYCSSENDCDDLTGSNRNYCLLRLCSQLAWKRLYGHYVKYDLINLTYKVEYF